MTENQAAYPADRKYTKTHEWVRAEGTTGTLGVTFYAQSELGDMVFVDLPEKGRALVAGEEMGTLESVKAVSEVYAPVSGEVIEVNEVLRDHPEKVNGDPYGEGWLIKVKVGNPREMDDLLSPDAYRSHVGEGGH